jgi:octaprenyl-diphosphate synthase
MMQKQTDSTIDAQRMLTRVESLIGAHLERVESVFWDELSSKHPFVREILAHLGGYRGKRLRPMLMLLSAEACGGVQPVHHTLAAVVEMIHTATLVHDDVLDEAETRRHVATINARWSNETSVLLGDYLFTHAFHLTACTGSAEACRLIGRATNIVCEGEMWQIAERGNLALTEERYFDIIEAKTAELCAVACYLGAFSAGVDPHVVQGFDGYGRSLGIAFQIADDILDVAGNEAVTGKSLGSDLEKQKLTLPVIHALAQSQGAQRDALLRLLEEPSRQARGELLRHLERTDAVAYARTRAQEFILQARQHLGVVGDSPARQILEDVAEFVTTRSA